MPLADNLLNRQFKVDTPNIVWAADITYVRTHEGWLYLAVVIHLFSRRVVGWAIANHLRTTLPLEALRRAALTRRPLAGLMHHSDRGCQYASQAYAEELSRLGMVASMSRRANCWDNAVVESFFGILKEELLYRAKWLTRSDALLAIQDYIENFYNVCRRHSTLGYVSPLEFERGTR